MQFLSLSATMQRPSQESCASLKDLVARICRLDHSLVPKLGGLSGWDNLILLTPVIFSGLFVPHIIYEFNTFKIHGATPNCSFSGLTQIEALFTTIFSALRKSILELHERFECGGGWGLERTFNKWVCSQPWRQIMPNFFEPLSQIASVFPFWVLKGATFRNCFFSLKKTTKVWGARAFSCWVVNFYCGPTLFFTSSFWEKDVTTCRYQQSKLSPYISLNRGINDRDAASSQRPAVLQAVCASTSRDRCKSLPSPRYFLSDDCWRTWPYCPILDGKPRFIGCPWDFRYFNISPCKPQNRSCLSGYGFQSRMRLHVCLFVCMETALMPPSILNSSQYCRSYVVADRHWITALWLPTRLHPNAVNRS